MNDRIKRALTRRELLRLGSGIGGGLFVSSLVSERLMAQAGSVAPRVLFIMSQNGVMTDGWQMSGGADSLTIGGTFAPLNRHASSMTVIEGLRYQHTAGHVGGSLTFLTNQPMSPNDQNDANTRSDGESLDYLLGRTLKERGHVGPNTLLTTAAGSDQWGGGEFITYEGSKKPIKAIGGADALFQRVFGDFQAPVMDAPTLPPDWKARGRQAALDYALAEYRALQQLLGPHEAAKLEEMAATIQGLEQELIARDRSGTTAGQACAPGDNPGGSARDADVFDRMSGILVEAMACEQTLVATVRFSHGPVENSKFHEWHHGEGAADWQAQHNKHMGWQAEQVATLLDRLKAKSVGTGNLLDHTLVVWGNEIGIGGAQEHGGERLPTILAGSLGGKIRNNQLIKLDAVEHSTLLVSIANALDIDIDGFGNMDGCERGPVPGLLA
jgi:hypothetical protein